MSLPRYGEYRDSGVDWLGEVPAHWEVRPLASFADVVNGYPFDSKLFNSGEGVPLVRIRDLGQVEPAARYNGEFVPAAAIDNTDILIGMDGDFNVGRWFGETPALLNQRMCCVRSEIETMAPLLSHSLPIPLKRINELTYATTVKHLAAWQVEKIRFAVPPLPEQRAIAAYLDRETGRIDRAVAEQRRLIALLAEKRQATISHAVTKGLDPTAPLKPSGVDWLGDVPAHWEVLQLKTIITDVATGTSVNAGDYPATAADVGVLKISAVSTGVLLARENKTVFPEDLHRVTCPMVEGSILVSRANTPDLVGAAALVDIVSDNIFLPDKLWQVRCDADDARYVHRWMQTPSYRDQVKMECSGASSSMQNLSREAFGKFVLARPPRDEQERIADHLDTATQELDALTTTARSAIDLLLERRAALVSAAVTGKIDVRGLVGEHELEAA